MIDMVKADLIPSDRPCGEVRFLQESWLDLPRFADPVDAVLGDNSFSFLSYPHDWTRLCNDLADRMSRDAALVVRILSAPKNHVAVEVEELIDRFSRKPSLNCTELRTSLLFNQYNPKTFTISTEAVVDEFEANRPKFERLLRQFRTSPENDLVTVKKYKGCGVSYYAPPLDDVLSLFSHRFKVTSVNFGPYEMAEYFPLIIAHRI